MSERERIQLNLRLDGHKELYEAVKAEAARQNTSVNSFVVSALKKAVGQQAGNQPAISLEAILEVVDSRLDTLVDSKLAERLEKLVAQSN